MLINSAITFVVVVAALVVNEKFISPMFKTK